MNSYMLSHASIGAFLTAELALNGSFSMYNRFLATNLFWVIEMGITNVAWIWFDVFMCRIKASPEKISAPQVGQTSTFLKS